MKSVNIAKFKSELGKYLGYIRQGEEVIVLDRSIERVHCGSVVWSNKGTGSIWRAAIPPHRSIHVGVGRSRPPNSQASLLSRPGLFLSRLVVSLVSCVVPVWSQLTSTSPSAIFHFVRVVLPVFSRFSCHVKTPTRQHNLPTPATHRRSSILELELVSANSLGGGSPLFSALVSLRTLLPISSLTR